MRQICLILGILVGWGIGVTAEEPGNEAPELATGYIEHFEVPERDSEGNLRWRLIGDRAKFRADGLLTVLNMRAEFYQQNKVELVFSSPTCTLDQPNRMATTDDTVRIEAPNMVVTGIGADWTAERNMLIIRSNVHVTLKEKLVAIPEEQRATPQEAVANTLGAE